MIPRVSCTAGEPLTINGYAIDFGKAISAVEFSLDGGEHWTRYATEGANDYQRVNWSFECTLEEPGFYIMHVRSVNELGEPSPEPDFIEIQVD